jgi:ATP-binding cassette subfamily B multidrug efflux pump
LQSLRSPSLLAVLYVIGFASESLTGLDHGGRDTEDQPQHAHGYFNRRSTACRCGTFDSHTVGDVLSCVSNDVDTFSQSMNQSFSTLVSSLALLGGSMIMMLLTNWVMAVMGIAAALVGMLLMTLVISRSQGYFSDQQTELGTDRQPDRGNIQRPQCRESLQRRKGGKGKNSTP